MMGRGHATMGGALWLSGCAVATLLGDRPSVAVFTVGTAVCAGAAIAPDIDHPESTVSHSVGPLTRGIAWMIAKAGIVIHAHTRTRRDRPDLDGHRTITHTALWALLSGLLVAAAGRWGGREIAAALVFFATHIGVQAALPPRHRRFRMSTGYRARFGRGTGYRMLFGRGGQRFAYNCRRLPIPVPTVAAAVAALIAYRITPGSGWWLGVAVGCGSLIHCLGDALTNSACPILAPIPIGRRGFHRAWFPVGPPRRFRFHTGGDTETQIVQPLLVILAGVATAVVAWPELSFVWDAAWSIGDAFAGDRTGEPGR